MDKQVYISDPDNRELVTSMESIDGEGGTIDPMLIMPGQVIKEKHFPSGLNDGIMIGVSESGYTNDLLSFEWLKHFDMQTRPAEGEWRMLIMDGHGSHLTKEFVDYAYEFNISPFLLPAHSTHLLQPLDIGVFQSFKYYHQLELQDSIRYRGVDYKWTDFLASFQSMRDQTFKLYIIHSAFENASLIPFNPSIVLGKLEIFTTLEHQLGPENSDDELAFEVDFTCIRTPNSPLMYQACTDFIERRLAQSITNELILTPTVARVIEKREKASKIAKLSGQLAIEELYKKRQAELEKVRPNGERTVQQFGTITVGDARLKVIARNEAEEAAKECIALKKAESQCKKEEYRARVESRKLERLVKKASKKAEKEAR